MFTSSSDMPEYSSPSGITPRAGSGAAGSGTSCGVSLAHIVDGAGLPPFAINRWW